VSAAGFESRLGELLIVGLPGTDLDPGAAATLKRLSPSGVILFAANLSDADQAARLARAAQETIGTPELPALICSDEEGGMVSQISGFWEVPLSARAVASSGGPPLVKDLAQRTARRLLALGINLNFAPVLDIDSNPKNPVIGIRSFGTTASQVTASGRAAIEGMLAAGIIPVVKHFPGHGDTSLDSHVALPVVGADEARMNLRELRPFEAAINLGVPVVMTAHVLVPAFEPDPARPATISPLVVNGLLRGRLRFQGVVITDALEMAGVTSIASHGEIAVRAIEAGCDLLLYSKLSPGPEEALVVLRDALRSGRLSEERIGASLDRIRALRASSAARPHTWSDALEREARQSIPPEELDRIAEGAIRMLKQGAGGIPLRNPIDVLEVNRPPSRAGMMDLLRAHGMNAREVSPDPSTWPKRLEGTALLTLASRGTLSAEDEATARAWLRRFPETVTVASLNPNVTEGWEEVRTLVTTFDNTPASRRALAKRLAGVTDPKPRRGAPATS
jgi:beta-N-acetylhexosaminidase